MGAGVELVIAVRTRLGAARFASIDELVATEVHPTPLGQRISDAVYRRILEDARDALRQFRTDAGGAAVPIEGHLVTARKR